MLQYAVANASAIVAFLQTTVTASALPKLKECPTFADEVHTPQVPDGNFNAILLESGEFPA
jgi:hypothetical protein